MTDLHPITFFHAVKYEGLEEKSYPIMSPSEKRAYLLAREALEEGVAPAGREKALQTFVEAMEPHFRIIEGIEKLEIIANKLI